MKTAKEIIETIEPWCAQDTSKHAAMCVLSDADEKQYYIAYGGTDREMAHLVTAIMSEDADFGKAIYAAACVYAHKYISEEEREKINNVSAAIAEVRKEMKDE